MNQQSIDPDSSVGAVAAISAALEAYNGRAALNGLITALATWVVQANIDPARIVTTLIQGIEVAEAAANEK